MARCMLKQSGLPRTMWTFAYKSAVFIHNRLPNSRTNGRTPLELWSGCEPQTNNIYLFGAQAGTGELQLNQVSFELGKVPVEVICEEQDNMIDKIPQISDLEVPKNLKSAKRSELWQWWKKACLDELNSLKEFDVCEVLDEDPDLKIAGSRSVCGSGVYSGIRS
ncbi:uncharacterized protein VP01_5950g1 [Puccinia sorghi]|uniref:Uncharacterized protein n=1 Tax=Puccinia sorghi TaxID=27349 RepID=A0A0L6UIF1_9BASI|nr:uncharacterized protein VP01_5950g1 [Puccinia sorghi]